MKQIIIIILTIGLLACNQGKTGEISKKEDVDDYYLLETLYHLCDTVIETEDTLKIVNFELDTIIIETGIFTFLQYDYPLSTPPKLITLSKSAIQFDNLGQKEKAKELYKNIIDFYLHERPQQLKEICDMNGYLQYEVNSAILCSYAYEQLGDKEHSIETLQPFLANVEAWNSKIHKRYIQLCIDKFGIDKVRAELKNCGRTIKLKKQDVIEKEGWVVNVFGADIGVAKEWDADNISASKADSLVRKFDFYKMIQ